MTATTGGLGRLTAGRRLPQARAACTGAIVDGRLRRHTGLPRGRAAYADDRRKAQTRGKRGRPLAHPLQEAHSGRAMSSVSAA